ncbi:uncharacterized protein O3C94_021790 [Discoglossus pictus]
MIPIDLIVTGFVMLLIFMLLTLMLISETERDISETVEEALLIINFTLGVLLFSWTIVGCLLVFHNYNDTSGRCNRLLLNFADGFLILTSLYLLCLSCQYYFMMVLDNGVSSKQQNQARKQQGDTDPEPGASSAQETQTSQQQVFTV